MEVPLPQTSDIRHFTCTLDIISQISDSNHQNVFRFSQHHGEDMHSSWICCCITGEFVPEFLLEILTHKDETTTLPLKVGNHIHSDMASYHQKTDI
jgi:hypothetical protein